MSARPERGGGDTRLARLIDLGRAAADASSTAPPDGPQRLERSLARRGERGRRGPLRTRWLLPAAAAAVLLGAALELRRPRAITFEVPAGQRGDAGYVSAGGGAGSVRFSDRSDLQLEAGTCLRVSELGAHGARVMLEEGLIHARIHHEAQSRWSMNAGPYTVHVTGTEFELSWRPAVQRFDLGLREGSVTVEGPLALGGLRLIAGQHLAADVVAHTLSVDDRGSSVPAPAAPSASPPPSSPAPSPWAPGVPGTAPSPAAREPRAAAGSLSPERPPGSAAHASSGLRASRQAWTGRMAQGDFEGVVEDAVRQGLERTVAEAPLSELAMLADAARYARRLEIAARTLTGERARFPRSVEARDAAFFLAGLAESEESAPAALDWYDTYLRENPEGALVSEALGRKMLLLVGLKATEPVHAVALEYLRRFPAGPYARRARKLSEAP